MRRFYIFAPIIVLMMGVLVWILFEAGVFTKNAEESREVVSVGTKMLLESEEYKKGSLEERRELASKMLNDMKCKRYIKGLVYFEENFLFSFLYADGSLGGIYLKDFATKPGELPMD